MSATFQPPVKLHPGTQRTILDVSPTAASTHTVWFENQADSILLTLFVNSSAGDVNVSLYSVTQGGPAETPVHELQILSFPTVSGPTTTLLVEVASVTTARLKLVATTTDSANFEVQARAINGGASDVRVVTTPTLYSTSILLPATEQSYTLPVGTRWFSIINHSIRDLQVSYTLGQSGTNYRVIPRGTCTTHPGVDSTAAITIYMQAAASGGRVEIESWA